MSTAEQTAWAAGWSAQRPAQIGYTAVPADGGTWRQGPRKNLEQRDLGLGDASDRKLGVQHIRVTGAKEPLFGDWHCHDVDFQCLYVLRGSIKFEMEDGETVVLQENDSAYIPPFYRHTQMLSTDFECVEFTSPAELGTITGRDAQLPARAASLVPQRKPVFSRDVPDNWMDGAGPRGFFAYRDLGTRGPSDGRIHLHVVKATGTAGEGTGWHYHTMAQWFMVLRGTADIRVETKPRQTLRVWDTMCIGSGPDMRHTVGPFSSDYVVIEICVPAEYDTIAVEAPVGAAD